MNLQSKSFRASDCGKLFSKSTLQYFPENNGENIWLMENHFARAATIHFKNISNPPSHTLGIAFHIDLQLGDHRKNVATPPH